MPPRSRSPRRRTRKSRSRSRSPSQLDLVKKDVFNILNIKNPSNEVIYYVATRVAEENTDLLIPYLRNADFELQTALLNLNPELLCHVYNVSPYIKNIIIRKYPKLIDYINNITEEDKKDAVLFDANNIKYISYPNEQLKQLAVQANWKLIKFFKNPSPEVQVLAFYNAVDDDEYKLFVEYSSQHLEVSDELEDAVAEVLGINRRTIGLTKKPRIISRTPSPVFSARSPRGSPRRSPKKRNSPSRRRK